MNKQTIINRLAALDLSQYPCSEIKRLIHNLGNVGFIITTLHSGKFITRARCEGNLLLASELSYKPQQYNDRYMRASTPQQTMFYGCVVPEKQLITDARYIAALECSSLIRQGLNSSGKSCITYGKWEVIDDIDLVTVVHKDSFCNANNSLLQELKSLYNAFLTNHSNMANDLDIVTEYFAKEFSKENVDGEDYNYLISAIFTEIITNEYNLDGVMYPSVQAGGDCGFNVAIKPSAVDNKMKLILAYETELIKNGSEITIGTKSRKGKILPNMTIEYTEN